MGSKTLFKAREGAMASYGNHASGRLMQQNRTAWLLLASSNICDNTLPQEHAIERYVQAVIGVIFFITIGILFLVFLNKSEHWMNL